MNHKLTPPDSAHTMYEMERQVTIAFQGYYTSVMGAGVNSVTFPRNLIQFDINHYLRYAPGSDDPPIDATVSFRVPSEVDDSNAIEWAVTKLGHMECFYPGILDHATAYSITIEHTRTHAQPIFGGFEPIQLHFDEPTEET